MSGALPLTIKAERHIGKNFRCMQVCFRLQEAPMEGILIF